MAAPTRIMRAYWDTHRQSFGSLRFEALPARVILKDACRPRGRPIHPPQRQTTLSAAFTSGRWLAKLFRDISIADFIVSLVALHRWARLQQPVALPAGPPGVPSPQALEALQRAAYTQRELQEASHYLRFANASFGWKGALFFRLAEARRAERAPWAAVLGSVVRGDATAACFHASVDSSALLQASPRSRPFLPAHYVFVDAQRRAVVLAVRGTLSLADVLTDLQPWRAPFPPAPLAAAPDLLAFDGMARSALSVLGSVSKTLEEALLARPGWGVVITGVSLGGGTALLCTAILQLMRERALLSPALATAPLRCVAFAPPPVIAGGSARAAAWVQSLPASSWFSDDDTIPRLSEDSASELLAALARVASAEPRRWRRVAMRPETQRAVAAAVAGERAAWRLAWGGGTGSLPPGPPPSCGVDAQPPARSPPPLRIPGRIFWVRAAGPPAAVGAAACNVGDAHTVTELAADAPELAAPRLAPSALRAHIPDRLAHALRDLAGREDSWEEGKR